MSKTVYTNRSSGKVALAGHWSSAKAVDPTLELGTESTLTYLAWAHDPTQPADGLSNGTTPIALPDMNKRCNS
eukprot:338027-Amphidinium_carterae.1